MQELQDQELIDVSTSPGQNGEVIKHQGNTCDDKNGNCKYAGLNTPFMEALVKTEGLMAVISGHDHRDE